MRDFKPGLIPTLMAVPAVLIMIGFGFWQLERLAWKNDLLDRIQERISAAPVALDKLSGDPAQDEYRRVILRGKFVHERELFMAARSLNGNVGLHVITKLVLDDGAAVVVNRGWVPDQRKDPARRAEGQSAGAVELVAVVRAGQKPGWFTPDNDVARNIWFYFDLPAMRAALGIGAGPAQGGDYWYAVAAPATPGGFPVVAQTRVNIPNDHLQYAVTWFVFALSLAAIYVLFGRRRARDLAKAGSP